MVGACEVPRVMMATQWQRGCSLPRQILCRVEIPSAFSEFKERGIIETVPGMFFGKLGLLGGGRKGPVCCSVTLPGCMELLAVAGSHPYWFRELQNSPALQSAAASCKIPAGRFPMAPVSWPTVRCAHELRACANGKHSVAGLGLQAAVLTCACSRLARCAWPALRSGKRSQQRAAAVAVNGTRQAGLRALGLGHPHDWDPLGLGPVPCHARSGLVLNP